MAVQAGAVSLMAQVLMFALTVGSVSHSRCLRWGGGEGGWRLQWVCGMEETNVE